MSYRYWFASAVVILALVVCLPQFVWGARHNKDLTGTQLARIEFSDKSALMQIDELGGIIEKVSGDTAWAYIRPEAFSALESQGYVIRWAERERVDNTLDDYHSNDQIQALFSNWQTLYPNLFHYESIGRSVQNRDLWVCKISDNVNTDEAEIEVKYSGAMHGEENVGTENMLRLIEELLTGYGTDTELTELVNDFEIWMLPLMNPDGYAVQQRGNANNVDLNRDFPDRIDDSVNTTAGRQPETAAMMNWTATRNFVLSGNFHGGTLVANFPFDGSYSGASVDTPTPEDNLFHYIAERYTQYNLPMWNSSEFTHGVTNGCEWYNVNGGMQDWNYVWMGGKDITFEISVIHHPASATLEQFWQDNRLGMRYYLLEAKYGARGIVTDSVTGLPLRANIQLGTSSYYTFSSALHGEYYRILRPGTYSLTFSAPGYQSKTFPAVTVVGTTPTILDVQLAPVPRAIVSTAPTSLSQTLTPCDSIDVPLTISNIGQTTLTWSALEGFTSLGGYGSATGAGWRFIDSDHAGGPAYSWVDISTRGSSVSFTTDDQNVGAYAVGFSFPFYGSNFTTFRMASDGWISFSSTVADYENTDLPSLDAQPNMIAAWWDDLSPQRAGSVIRRYSNLADSLVISYTNIQSYEDNGLYNFQFIFLSSGKIVFQYANMGTNRLNSATIGLQNSLKDKGTRVVYDATYIHNNMAIAFYPTSAITVIPSSGSLPPSDSQIVTARLRSCYLPDGISQAILAITSNDIVTPVLNVPVTFDVSLAPLPVDDLTITTESSNVRLSWGQATRATSYRIYRNTTSTVDIVPENLVTSVSDTTYLDTVSPGDMKAFYVIISVR